MLVISISIALTYNRLLECGIHKCREICHYSPCISCSTSPSVTTCPCGSSALDMTRVKCTDPIPTCLSKCKKMLSCGIHMCELTCHEGECGACVGIEMQECRCGRRSVEVKCVDRGKQREIITCRETCTDLLACGKHQCPKKCCLDKGKAHSCELICARELSCGLHKCKRFCHDVCAHS
jgi:hypothetical protein